MRHQTVMRMERAWRELPDDHLFESWDEFYETAAELGNVDGDGSEWCYCRRFCDEPFGPSNLKLVHVAVAAAWDQVFYPAI